MVASVAAAAAAASSSAHAAAGRRAKREPASMHAGIRRSRSEPHLRCSRRGGAAGAALTTSRSIGVFPFQFGAAPLRPPPLPDGGGDGSRLLTVTGEPEPEPEMPAVRRPDAHWLDRLLELRSRFHDPTKRHSSDDDDVYHLDGDDDDVYHLDGDDDDDEHGCGVSYEEEEDDEAEDDRWDRESFSKLLARAPLGEARLFAQLAFLCNMAYVIREIKVEELKKYYGLRFVTSSLEKKAEAGAIRSKVDVDSTRPRAAPACEVASEPQPRRPIRSHLAYEVAASAASYVQASARGLLSFGGHQQPPAGEGVTRRQGGQGRLYNSGVAAYVAASTVTAVVAAEDEARQEAARDLRSSLSSPCEWFACDEADARTRCFVIQGSDSLASWQANLLFEPTKFENTGVLVHRGIYEAAKGIYEQVMPEIEPHVRVYKERARLRFTGHSLGGSLALLVSLMLVARGVVGPEALLPVVTFGAPSVFCGGQRVLEALGVGEGHVRSVAMHRDIVPRAFSCRYPGHAIALLKRLNGVLRTHPCLNKQKVLYTPMGTTYILQPDSKASPHHPFLPDGAALFRLDPEGRADRPPRPVVASALRAFLNSPHPLETLSDLSAYGSEGAILRDHESSNYFRALNALTKVPRRRKQPEIVWQLPGVERLQQYWWPGIASTVVVSRPVAVRNKELVSEA